MPTQPDWNRLFETASAQDGYFTTRQAAEAGYSRPLLARYLSNGKIVRVQHGVYRLVHYPSSDHENLVVVWLWSKQKGVFSHETALALHDLSDALPAVVHITLPAAWKKRRLTVPNGVELHNADIPPNDWSWFGAVPVTTPERTLLDCVAARVPPDLVAQAHADGLRRGLIPREMTVVRAYVVDMAGGDS